MSRRSVLGERLELGPLELKVLEVLRQRKRASTVRSVQPSFPRLAYTTLMTTLDRQCSPLAVPLYASVHRLIEALVAFGR
jgi:hypothetical protein